MTIDESRQRHRELNRLHYAAKLAAMTEEERTAFRAVRAERTRAWRALPENQRQRRPRVSLTPAQYQARYRERHPERLKENQRAHVNRRRAFMNAIKDRPCADCGGSFPPYCMDFDHVRGVKSFNV